MVVVFIFLLCFFFKQKTAYEMRISDWEFRRALFRSPAQPGLGLAAAAGRALVADLAAGAGGRAGERRDRGRMVVGLDLDAERAVARWLGTVRVCLRVGTEAFRRIPLHHRGVVAVRGQRVLRRARSGVLDYLETPRRRPVALPFLPGSG